MTSSESGVPSCQSVMSMHSWLAERKIWSRSHSLLTAERPARRKNRQAKTSRPFQIDHAARKSQGEASTTQRFLRAWGFLCEALVVEVLLFCSENDFEWLVEQSVDNPAPQDVEAMQSIFPERKLDVDHLSSSVCHRWRRRSSMG